MAQQPNIKLFAHDITTLLTSGEQTHHELLLFGLENATKIYNGTYLEPAFFPILQQRRWTEVISWFPLPRTITSTHIMIIKICVSQSI